MATLDINIRQANADFKTIKEAIVDSGVLVEDGTKTADYARKVGEVYEAGKQAGQDYFTNIYFVEKESGSWINAFAGGRWVDEIYNPPREIVTGTQNNLCNSMFAYSNITDTKVYIVIRSPSNNRVFAGSGLVTIRLEVTEDVIYANWFDSCTSLVHLIMKGTIGQNGFNVRWSTLLDKESLTSIINALSTTTSGLTITLSTEAVDKAFEPYEGSNDGSTSPEWLTLVSTRSNWTIALA